MKELNHPQRPPVSSWSSMWTFRVSRDPSTTLRSKRWQPILSKMTPCHQSTCSNHRTSEVSCPLNTRVRTRSWNTTTTASPGTAVTYPMKKSSRYFRIICETPAKGLEKKRLLEKIFPNVYNLEDVGCPSLRELNVNANISCNNHVSTWSLQCAAQNVSTLRAWLLESKAHKDSASTECIPSTTLQDYLSQCELSY